MKFAFEKTTQKIKAKKIILATGTLSLSKILLNSLHKKIFFFVITYRITYFVLI